MQIQTHYTTLGLASTVPTPVIRAAYKALVLLHHPDKTVHLPASERAAHSAIFCSVQEAFDVLGNASLKVSYDAELANHHGTVDTKSSTFHHGPATSRQSKNTKHKSSIRLTTAEEKAAMKAKTEAAIAQLREQRKARDSEEENLSLTDLEFVLKTWRDLAHNNRDDAIIFAHSTIMIHEYNAKVTQKISEHEDWVNNMATPKHATYAPKTRISTPDPEECNRFASVPGAPRKKTQKAPNSPLFLSSPKSPIHSTTSTSTLTSRDEKMLFGRRQARAQHTTYFLPGLPTSSGPQDIIRQTQQVKVAAVRAEKQAQKQRAEQLAMTEAKRVAKVRAKVGPSPKGRSGVQVDLVQKDGRKEVMKRKEAGSGL